MATAERQLRAPLPAEVEPGLRLCFGMIKVWILTEHRSPERHQQLNRTPTQPNTARAAQDAVREGDGAGRDGAAARHHRGE